MRATPADAAPRCARAQAEATAAEAECQRLGDEVRQIGEAKRKAEAEGNSKATEVETLAAAKHACEVSWGEGLCRGASLVHVMCGVWVRVG